MNPGDSNRVGSRGENIFTVLITKKCSGQYWFDEIFLGEKAETADFLVKLVDPSSGYGIFYVQVKSSEGRYTGKKKTMLKRDVSAEDIQKLSVYEAPVYIVGIDTEAVEGYILGVTSSSKKLSGIPTTHKIDCATIQRLWAEVDTYWKTPKNRRRRKTQFK